jgi:hypothetical protein
MSDHGATTTRTTKETFPIISCIRDNDPIPGALPIRHGGPQDERYGVEDGR